MSENIVAKGKIFELVQLTQPDGRIFEVARRAPGVRLIIPDRVNKKVLLTKEFRRELNNFDYRLPGGKVFDTLDEFEIHRASGNDILGPVLKKVKGEGAEETGTEIIEAELFRKSTLGATVEWDLYIYEVTKWEPHRDGQQLEEGENIDANGWFGYEEAKKMVLGGRMAEERVALILLQWLNKQ